MSREVHLRFSESARVKSPRATQFETPAYPFLKPHWTYFGNSKPPGSLQIFRPKIVTERDDQSQLRIDVSPGKESVTVGVAAIYSMPDANQAKSLSMRDFIGGPPKRIA